MRPAWIKSQTALTERLKRPIQLDVTEPESEMPPYMEQFLAHLRLLVGLPFDYLVPDERLLPDESIRFFYLDRSWTDRLVDGAIAVGKIGTREQAHHRGHAPAVNQQLDLTERIVRVIQRGLKGFTAAKSDPNADTSPADTVTGFLLRSSAVSGWPHMDVRAYKTAVPEKFLPSDEYPKSQQLTTLRLELLSPGVMIALFQGVPQLVILEEPHAGVMFGVHIDNGIPKLYLRDQYGNQIPVPHTTDQYYDLQVPFRSTNARVVHVTELYKRLNQVRTGPNAVPTAVPVTGSASYAIAVLDPPWRQRFEGTVDDAGTQSTSGGFVAHGFVAQRVADIATLQQTENVVLKYGH